MTLSSGLILAAALALLVCARAAWAQSALVLYPIDAADKVMASNATMAMKASLKQGHNLQVIEYRQELPSVRRAVIEGRLGKADLSAADDAAKLKIARALDAGYYMKGSVEGDLQSARLVVTAVETRGGRKYDYNSRADSPGGDPSTLMLSVANTVSTQFMTQVLDVVPPAAPVTAPGPMPPPTPRPPSGADNARSSQAPPDATRPPAVPPPSGPARTAATPDSLALEAAGYAAQGESLAVAGDLAGAIQAMRQAVNLAPGDVSYRVKLASFYTQKGMPEEAAKELERASSISPGNDEARQALARQLAASGSPDQALKTYRETLAKDPKNLQARLALGDALWNEGKPDDAALEYAQAASDNPAEAAPYQRLARLAAARGQFVDTTGHVATAKHLQNQEDAAPVESGLYKSLIQSADMAFYRERDQLDVLEKGYTSRGISREDYYKKARALLTEVEQLADFLSDLNAPVDQVKAHLHRSLAASLLAQSITSLQEWLRKDEARLKQDSQRFLRDSDREMEAAAALERKRRAG